MTSTNEDTERKSGKIDAEKIIPASRRPDGSLRKERRVRAGYTAPEEIPVYVAPHIRVRNFRRLESQCPILVHFIQKSNCVEPS